MRLMKGLFLIALGASLGVAHAADEQSRPGPQCYGASFGSTKVDTSVAAPRLAPSGTFEQEAAFDKEASGKLEVRNKQLVSVPPEIERIRKGYTSSFVGGGLNNGLSEWFGIDLERHLVVQVVRRSYTSRDPMMRPFSDVDLVKNPHVIARKWQSDSWSEEEVVLLSQGQPGDLALFVCSANALWAHHQPLPNPVTDPPSLPLMSDTLSAYIYLLDFGKDQSEVLLKRASGGDPVDTAAKVVRSHAGVIDW
ncbi:hypothetical protein DyAD56_02120 [Dyella sp. AD56]|uniref:hypothetical protein n=1 Tax=Dyella sp. AD56 TaxID=1528744 RepID=UPI000C8342FB|nr:hypothetical protein [Dyella sp. AD56]PMQ07542.1 hypothetical protein DyAD56_02120 [Dyella sp. AD56]